MYWVCIVFRGAYEFRIAFEELVNAVAFFRKQIERHPDRLPMLITHPSEDDISKETVIFERDWSDVVLS